MTAKNTMANSLFGKILVANDGSEGARKALAAAIEWAHIYEAELHVVPVAVNCDPRRRLLSVCSER